MAKDTDESFKITDRRMFNADGTLRDGSEPEAEDRNESDSEKTGNVVSFPGAGNKKQTGPPGLAEREYGEPADLPPPTFDSFINMLAVEAAMHLGLIENPMETGHRVDLDAARHLVDTMAMLQEKTRGNLTPDEAEMIESMLAELRLQFVAVSKRR